MFIIDKRIHIHPLLVLMLTSLIDNNSTATISLYLERVFKKKLDLGLRIGTNKATQ